MALDPIMHFNQPARSERDAMKDREELSDMHQAIEERNALQAEIGNLETQQAELHRLMDIEEQAVGRSNAWEDMAGKADDLGDEIGRLIRDKETVEREIPYDPRPWAPQT